MRKVLIALVAVVAWSAMPAFAQEPAAPELPERDADLVLAVQGFSCEMCSAKLEKKLSELEGAEAVIAADWEEGLVSVWLKKGHDVEDETLATLVQEAGFVLTEIRRAEVEAEPAH